MPPVVHPRQFRGHGTIRDATTLQHAHAEPLDWQRRGSDRQRMDCLLIGARGWGDTGRNLPEREENCKICFPKKVVAWNR